MPILTVSHLNGEGLNGLFRSWTTCQWGSDHRLCQVSCFCICQFFNGSLASPVLPYKHLKWQRSLCQRHSRIIRASENAGFVREARRCPFEVQKRVDDVTYEVANEQAEDVRGIEVLGKSELMEGQTKQLIEWFKVAVYTHLIIFITLHICLCFFPLVLWFAPQDCGMYNSRSDWVHYSGDVISLKNYL